jgi:hypothetical protein
VTAQSHGAGRTPQLRLAPEPPAPSRLRRRYVLVSAIALLAIAGTAAWATTGRPRPALFTPRLSGRDRLVTNEYAHWNPQAPASRIANDWDVTSGSLFVHNGVAWSGAPDKATPDATSSNGSGSSVFRMTTRRHDFGDVAVSLNLRKVPYGKWQDFIVRTKTSGRTLVAIAGSHHRPGREAPSRSKGRIPGHLILGP